MTNHEMQRVMYNIFNEIDAATKLIPRPNVVALETAKVSAELVGVKAIQVLLLDSTRIWQDLAVYTKAELFEDSKRRINDLIIQLITIRAAIEEEQGTLPLVPDLTSS